MPSGTSTVLSLPRAQAVVVSGTDIWAAADVPRHQLAVLLAPGPTGIELEPASLLFAMYTPAP